MEMNTNSKSSYYNFIVNTEDGGQVIYNTKTGAIDIIEPESKSEVQKILMSSEIIPDSSAELYTYMLNQGYIVDKEKDELIDIATWSKAADKEKMLHILQFFPRKPAISHALIVLSIHFVKNI